MTAGGWIGDGGATKPSVGAYASAMTDLPRHIVITGLMGAGKTSVGRAIAGRLGRTWRDSDADIEASTGLTVRELRDREGVDAMHDREYAQLLDALASPEPNVISAAARVIDDAQCRAAMDDPAVMVIWLRAEPEVLATRFASADDHRPVYGDSVAAFLADQAARREPLAAGIGALMVEIGHLTQDEVIEQVAEALG